MQRFQKIVPCLWFDDQAEEAVNFYAAIFKNSKITAVSRYGEAGREIHGKKPGTVLTIAFELDGNPFTALNGGPVFKFNEAVSLQVHCETQEEVDYYCDRLSTGGDPKAQQCGCSKTNTASRGRLSQSCCLKSSWTPTPANRSEP